MTASRSICQVTVSGPNTPGNRSRRVSADLIEGQFQIVPGYQLQGLSKADDAATIRRACGNSMKRRTRPYSAAIGISSICSCSTTPASGSNSPIHGFRASTDLVWA